MALGAAGTAALTGSGFCALICLNKEDILVSLCLATILDLISLCDRKRVLTRNYIAPHHINI